MAKNIGQTTSTNARKSLSHARAETTRARPEKKVRRTIFKTDQWYQNAALSIGIAGRPKGARPGAAVRAKDGAD